MIDLLFLWCWLVGRVPFDRGSFCFACPRARARGTRKNEVGKNAARSHARARTDPRGTARGGGGGRGTGAARAPEARSPGEAPRTGRGEISGRATPRGARARATPTNPVPSHPPHASSGSHGGRVRCGARARVRVQRRAGQRTAACGWMRAIAQGRVQRSQRSVALGGLVLARSLPHCALACARLRPRFRGRVRPRALLAPLTMLQRQERRQWGQPCAPIRGLRARLAAQLPQAKSPRLALPWNGMATPLKGASERVYLAVLRSCRWCCMVLRGTWGGVKSVCVCVWGGEGGGKGGRMARSSGAQRCWVLLGAAPNLYIHYVCITPMGCYAQGRRADTMRA